MAQSMKAQKPVRVQKKGSEVAGIKAVDEEEAIEGLVSTILTRDAGVYNVSDVSLGVMGLLLAPKQHVTVKQTQREVQKIGNLPTGIRM